MKKIFVVFFALLFLIGFTNFALATTLDGLKHSVGIQTIGSNWGPSMVIDWDKFPGTDAQPIVFLDDFGVAGRVRHAFWRKEYFDLYLSGMLGLDFDPFLGASAGINWNWQQLGRDFPPINWSLELGAYGSTNLSVGLGVHYSF